MTEELRQTMLDHISRIEFNIKRLHEQAHTGIIRLDSGYASDSIQRCAKLRQLIMDFK